MKYLIYSLLFLILATSCTKTKPLIITLPESEQKLAISSVVIPGNIMAVSVSYSFSALKNAKDSLGNNVFDSTLYQQFLVSHALVTISYNGRTDTLSKITPGIYASTSVLQIVNANYTLNVYDSATQLRVFATSMMLQKVNFDSLYFEKERTATDTTLKIHFSVADNMAEENYYMVSYYNTAASPVYNSVFSNPNKDKFVLVELYSDKVVEANGKIKVDKNFFLPDENDTLIIELANISKGYYEFLSAYKKSDQLIYQLLGEPVNLPTNINIGYGYFSTFNPSFKIVDLSKL